MDTRSVNPSDIVLVNQRGRLFYALVRGTGPGGLLVEPLERGVRSRHAAASEVVDCWHHSTTDERGADVPAAQYSFDHLLDR